MPGIERDMKSGERTCSFGRRRQSAPGAVHEWVTGRRSASLFAKCKTKRSCVPVSVKILRRLRLDLDQVRVISLRAVNVVEQMHEFVVGNRGLKLLQLAPIRFATERAQVLQRIR